MDILYIPQSKRNNFPPPFSFYHMFPYCLLWTCGVLNIQLRVRVMHACCGSHSRHARGLWPKRPAETDREMEWTWWQRTEQLSDRRAGTETDGVTSTKEKHISRHELWHKRQVFVLVALHMWESSQMYIQVTFRAGDSQTFTAYEGWIKKKGLYSNWYSGWAKVLWLPSFYFESICLFDLNKQTGLNWELKRVCTTQTKLKEY